MVTRSNNGDSDGRRRRTRLVRPYPAHTLEEVLRVAHAVWTANAGLPMATEALTKTLGTTIRSSGFIMRLNSSTKYGLTQGAHKDARVSLTPLGAAVVSPKDDEERLRALVDASRRPEIFERFYAMLDGKHLPEDRYAESLLQRELGVHPGLSSECLGILKANGLYTGILRQVEGALRVELRDPYESEHEAGLGIEAIDPGPGDIESPADEVNETGSQIFLGYGEDSEAVEQVRQVLDEFGLPYSEPRADVDGRPVPAGASEMMRECTAAVLVVGGGREWQDMQYQLGAASVLYGDRLVVVEEGSEPADATLTLASATFDPDRAEEFGLALLRALREAGILRLTL